MNEFKEGLKDGIAGLLSVMMTLCGMILLTILVGGLQVWLWCVWLTGYKQPSYNALVVGHVQPSFIMVTDTYLYWYDYWTNKFNI